MSKLQVSIVADLYFFVCYDVKDISFVKNKLLKVIQLGRAKASASFLTLVM